MSTAARQIALSPQEYLALERAAEYKNEYVGRQIHAMTGASRQHNRITVNLTSALHTQLRGGPCEPFSGGMRVHVGPAGAYLYPDLVVTCGEARFEDAHLDTLLNPTLVIEVLSPSTELYDRVDKFALYRRLETLREFVLVAQNAMRVECFRRQGDVWIFSAISGDDAVLRLESVGCELPLREIYERVDFGDDPDAADIPGPER